MATTATATTTATAATWGMQLDAALAHLDALSSLQLYGLIVLVTVLIATLLLGNAQPLPTTTAAVAQNDDKNNKSNTTAGGHRHRHHPEPRWYIFRLFNYAVLLAFAGSVADFAWFATSTAQLVRVLVTWCACLIYFFGFFGVSIVHDDVVVDATTTADTATTTATTSLEKSSSSLSDRVPVKDLGCGATPAKSQKNNKTVSPQQVSSSLSVVDDDDDNTSADHQEWSDERLAQLVLDRKWKDHELEKRLDPHRAVQVRRRVVQRKLQSSSHDDDEDERFDWTQHLPAEPSLDYSAVHGANCEIVIGYVPLPVGLVGPLTVNGEPVHVPMATTEGCLVASTNRGCKAISASSDGVTAVVTRDGITRAPCVRCKTAARAAQLQLWCASHLSTLQRAFAATTRYGRLSDCQVTVAGKNAYVRLVCVAGDAMGMNMVSKGSLAVIDCLRREFDPDLELVALSGNLCTDKKAAAVNWLQGRGKSVVAEAVIPADVVRNTLKTTVAAMVYTNLHKNLIGSAMAGALGGFNAHASNIVTAVFLATGQDPAQNVESSQCITLLEETEDGDLWISCTMPSIEVGTVGGGTRLAAQAACLELVGCRGGHVDDPGANARRLATVVASATLAGELSLLAALAANTLVQAHMQHNRKT